MQEAESFRADVERRIRREALKSAIPEGLPEKTAEIVMRGLAAELGDFPVDVKSWKPKDEAKITEALKGYDLSYLAPQQQQQGARVVSPPITTTEAQRPARGVLKPGRFSQQQQPSLAKAIAAEVLAAQKK